ncbi:MAG: flagellar basal-body rod protein FlgB [Desulfobulbaceae bacterium A2]|nr:MAG: flagellar basal-body rod protein FlgB [Desulfobulbaceae bacterium A2]
MSTIRHFDPTMRLLTKVLDLRTENQQVIAANIANAETPNYSPARFDFADELQSAVEGSALKSVTTQPGHIPLQAATVEAVEGKVSRSPDRTGIGDANGVNVDQEMLRLSENQILYEAAVQMLNKKLGLLKYVVRDGK